MYVATRELAIGSKVYARGEAIAPDVPNERLKSLLETKSIARGVEVGAPLVETGEDTQRRRGR